MYLACFAFLSFKMEFSVLRFRKQVVYFEMSHPDTNRAKEGVTSVDLWRGKLSDAQSTRLNLL